MEMYNIVPIQRLACEFGKNTYPSNINGRISKLPDMRKTVPAQWGLVP